MTSIEQSAAAMARYVAELERRVAELEALNAERNRQNARAFADVDRMRAKLMELAGDCAECGGSGLVTVRGMCGGVEMDCDDQPCPDCADIREAAMGGREGE